MKKIFLFLFLFINTIMFATTNIIINDTISGTITDTKTNEYLSGVKLKIIDTTNNKSFIVYTDLDGKFNLILNKTNNYKLFVDYISYESKELKLYDYNKFVNIKIDKI